MCIIAFQYKTNPQYELIVAANRDEFYERPTKPAHLWPTTPAIFAGQDERLGGTWIGVGENGRFVAITNYRNPKLDVLKPISRGKIATDFLFSSDDARTTVEQLRRLKNEIGPYNVLLYDGVDFLHYNNVFDEMTIIEPGTHTLCNATMNTAWPKTVKLHEQFEATLQKPDWHDDELLDILRDETIAKDNELPSTGVPYEMEKALSAIFIKLPNYGTRSSTIIKYHQTGAHFVEQTFENGEPTTKVEQHINFKLKQKC